MLPIGKYPDQVVTLDYFRSPEALFFTRRSRKGDKIDLCRINVTDGTVTELISEECAPHINLTLSGYRIIEKGKYFIWWSERTGKGNYYLYNSDGRLLNRITHGDNLVAGSIVHIDTLRRNIILPDMVTNLILTLIIPFIIRPILTEKTNAAYSGKR